MAKSTRKNRRSRRNTRKQYGGLGECDIDRCKFEYEDGRQRRHLWGEDFVWRGRRLKICKRCECYAEKIGFRGSWRITPSFG